MTLSEIFTVPAPEASTSGVKDEVNDSEEINEGELVVRENISQAIASNKTGGEGNAWMKMMNL